jgi:hypothetical protein
LFEVQSLTWTEEPETMGWSPAVGFSKPFRWFQCQDQLEASSYFIHVVLSDLLQKVAWLILDATCLY